jgi:hypothetical protein
MIERYVRRMQIQRILGRYFRDSEEPQGESDVTDIPFDVLRELFHPPEDDPLMYNVYDVETAHALILQPYVKDKIDLDRFEYKIEAYQALEPPSCR